MSIRSSSELKKLQVIGRIVRTALDEMSGAVRPGVTTAGLDQVCAAVLRKHGAETAPPKVYGFPGAACISVNDQAIHGIPGQRVIEEGDLVKLDVTAEKDGFFADAAVTVPVGKVTQTAADLVRCAERSFRQALTAASAGNRVYEIGRSVEREVRRCGFSVMRELCGHGVGRAIHEEPSIPNYHDPRRRTRLHEGLVITIEPIIAAGNGHSELQTDKWTICTADGSLAAHYEHTIVITKDQPILLTAA
jgi:methionyl aminopeptidase